MRDVMPVDITAKNTTPDLQMIQILTNGTQLFGLDRRGYVFYYQSASNKWLRVGMQEIS